MSSTILNEAERVMTICNACRYCEGFCAVFPAMELRRTFTGGDLKYLANLCHNCSNCYYACQYAPPHGFALNLPNALGQLRLSSYREFTRPAVFSGLFNRNGRVIAAITVMCVALIGGLIQVWQGAEVFFAAHTGENAFYRVIPHRWMVLPAIVLAIYILAGLFKGAALFWQKTAGNMEDLLSYRAHLQALWDVLSLRYLDGGGHGCDYPDDRFSMWRRWFHHAVFYGFALCFASTTIAAVYHYLLHKAAPYPFFSWPVLLGSVGGLSLIVGSSGLLYLKYRMDTVPAVSQALGLDVGFSTVLFLTSLTGLLLLLLRATPMMGVMLAVHLGMVAALFITMPYGKFVHAVYRYLALVRHAAEQNRNRV